MGAGWECLIPRLLGTPGGTKAARAERVLIHGPALYSPGNYWGRGARTSAPRPCFRDKNSRPLGRLGRWDAFTTDPNCLGGTHLSEMVELKEPKKNLGDCHPPPHKVPSLLPRLEAWT